MNLNYDLGRIRTLLTEGFSDEELRALCFDLPEFKSVYHQLAQNTGKAEIVGRLLEHVERTRQLDHLLELAQTHNPAQYAGHEPYLYADYASDSPYLGMRYFDVNDADQFFGRELLTAKLVTRLLSGGALSRGAEGQGGRGEISPARFLAVVGASGSGKSSVVRAGLVPALRRGQSLADGSLPSEGSSQWPVHIITPTAHPLEELAISLTRDSESVSVTERLIEDLSKSPRSLHLYVRKLFAQSSTPTPALIGRGRLFLIVDQFEELFTLCRNETERRAFIDNLLTAVNPKTGDSTLVVLTLRADFYAHCAQYENLREALARYQEYIGPMSAEELRQAIELPAQRAGYEFEPGLIDLILRDVGDEPGALPLLSHALLETWRRRQSRTLTLAGYAEAGGVRSAIAQTAESIFGNLTLEQQTIARRIFLHLTELGEGAQDTRRRVSRAELEMMTGDFGEEQSPVPGHPSSVAAVLQMLVTARLVTTDQDTAEVAHEALIREWPTLRQWLNDNREGLRLYRQLSEATQEWQRLSRDPDVLYRGAKLAQAGEWAEQHPAELNTLEYQFLTASKQAEENERLRELEQARALAEAERRRAETQAQATRRARQFAAGFVALFLVAVSAAIFGWVGQNQARRQADLALAQLWQARGQVIFETKPLLGLRLAFEGWALAHPFADQQMQEVMVESVRNLAQYGRLLTLGQGDIEDIYYTNSNPSIFILDRIKAPGELRRTLDGTLIENLSGPVSFVFTVDYSKDVNLITGAYFVLGYSDDTPGELRRTADGTLIATLSGPVSTVIFSSGETKAYFVVSYRDDTPSELRRTADGILITTLPSVIKRRYNPVSFSRDEAAFIVSYDDDTPSELRRTTDGSLIATLSGSLVDDNRAIFGENQLGTFFGAIYKDGSLGELRRTDSGAIVPLSGPISGVTFSIDKVQTYFIVSYKNNIPSELRRAADSSLITPLSGPVSCVSFSPDETGSYLVVGYRGDIPGELRRTADGTIVKALVGPLNDYTGSDLSTIFSCVDFSPDEAGTYFIVRYSDGLVNELRRTKDGTVISSSSDRSLVIRFSRDKTASYFLISDINSDDEIRRTADESLLSTLSGPVSDMIFNPDKAEAYFVVCYINNIPGELRRTTDGTIIKTLPGPTFSRDYISSEFDTISSCVNFSPDPAATYFVVTYADNQRELWWAKDEPHRLAKLGLGLSANFYGSTGFHFDLTNGRLLTWHNDGRAFLLDLAWLRAMDGKAEEMPIEELVRIACAGPFASGLFNEAELKPYLGNREPQACKK